MSAPLISELLPHAPPMLWLDELVSGGEHQVQCKLVLREDHVFVEDGAVEPLVSLEWMAQAVAALAGLRDRAQALAPRPGFLIAIPEASFEVDAFQLGDELLITATRVWGDDQLASFECSVERRGAVVARAQLSVYRRAPREAEAP
jgi:predicted hotdog family 3-hydroxylacyl-ACP dehydratase